MRPLHVIAALAAPLALAACSDSAAAKAIHRWTCAMHPGYLSDKPGECPICGMRLVPVEAAAKPGERKVLYWRSPMDPRQTSPVPRKDAMGMDYVPVYADEAASGVISVDPERRRLIGLRTVRVERRAIDAPIRTSGRVAYDETRIAKVQPRFDGYIERLDANFTGKQVEKGQPLAAVYSPELLATEQEYLLALKARPSLAASGLPDAAEAARARLELIGIGRRQLDEIARTGKPVRALTLTAPISGFVTQKSAVAGARVSASEPLFEIADLSRVWVLADVYENELPRVRVGQEATVTLAYWPGRVWRGRVSWIYPAVDDKTRTVKVRIAVDNPKTELRPEMFADVVLATDPRRALVIPDDAVIDSGTRKLAFVSLGEGRLEPREIETGVHARGLYEVRRGLAEGDEVAAGASFLLDSESQLRSAVRAMAPAGDGGAP